MVTINCAAHGLVCFTILSSSNNLVYRRHIYFRILSLLSSRGNSGHFPYCSAHHLSSPSTVRDSCSVNPYNSYQRVREGWRLTAHGCAR